MGMWREEAGPQATLLEQQPKGVGPSTSGSSPDLAPVGGASGGWGLQGGWETESYSQHPAPGIRSLVIDATPGHPMEARKSRKLEAHPCGF